FFCSDRGERGGCGHTRSLFLAAILPRHTVTASLLWELLVQLLANPTVRSAAHALRLPLALESVYHLLQRLRRRLDPVRVCLWRRQKAPESVQSDPLLQTAEHLKGVFPDALCPVSEFQLAFQQPLLG